jgi:pachytene checkpoint protein 2
MYHEPSITYTSGIDTSSKAQGMSGRALRRLPVLALARYIGVGHLCIPQLEFKASASSQAALDSSTEGNGGANVEIWLDGMEGVVEEQAEGRERLI